MLIYTGRNLYNNTANMFSCGKIIRRDKETSERIDVLITEGQEKEWAKREIFSIFLRVSFQFSGGGRDTEAAFLFAHLPTERLSNSATERGDGRGRKTEKKGKRFAHRTRWGRFKETA